VSGIKLSGVIERYHEMLAAADVPGMLKQFDDNGLVREPIGDREVHRGRNELLRFFDRLFASGGMSLERCSLTDDGASCALEYNLTAWGSIQLPHQAGIAIYERSRAGLLAAVRLYDEVERPSVTH